MKTILILSGGLDSTILLSDLLSRGHQVAAVSFNYGQRHRKELEAAAEACASRHVRHDIIDLSSLCHLLAAGGSALLGGSEVPEGHYEHESMRATVVPNRNMIMLAVAAGVADARGFDAVAYGAHAGDHAIYPDCRESFTVAMEQALSLCSEKGITLLRPFIRKTKAEIVALGVALGVAMEATWSCYKGEDIHCGKCGTCVERREAFALAGVSDLTEYTC